MHRMLVAAIALLAGAAAYAAPEVALVEDGKAVAEVVLPAGALKVERFAAEELVKFVKRATGATLPVVRERKPGRTAVLVGRASGLSGFMPNEARVVVKDGALLLAGGDGDGDSKKWTTPAGTLFAVYDFLEREVGVRWLWPDESVGTSVPRRRSLAVAAGTDRTWRPELVDAWARNFEQRFGRRLCRARKVPPRYPEGVNGHAFGHWWKKYGKSHPEFFEMNANGTRVPGSMCVANPAFHAEIVRLWREARAKEPGVKFDINARENDTRGKCQCPLCKAWNDPEADPKDASERYAHFYKALYDLAKADDPDVKIHAYAYSNYRNPPRLLKLPRNVHMEYVPSPKFPYTPETKKVIFDRIHAWVASGATLNYRPNVLDGYAMPEDYSVDYYAEFQEMRKAHMDYIDVDGPNVSYSTQGPLIYVMGRLMVDPSARLEDLRDEYFGAFGPAKDAVREYWDWWDRYTRDNAEMFHEVPKKHNPIRHGMFFGFHYAFYAHHLFPPEVLAKGAALIGRALEAAKDSPDDLKRVEFLAAGLEHARLCVAACAVFADKKSSVEKRLAALNAVRDFRRDRLPKYASNVAAWTRNGYNEQLAWTFDAFDPDRMIDLPLEWKYNLDPKDVGEGLGYAKADFDDSGWKTVLTDRHLEYQGVEPGYENVWYRHVVEIPEKFHGRRTIVRFGAIDESCRFWANGQYVGRFDYNPAVVPRSWEKPLEFDVTPFLGGDGRLVIALKVINHISRGGLVKPSRVLFFDESDLKAAVDADHPLDDMSFRSFGTRIERRGKGFAFLGGDKPAHGRIGLGMLKTPAGKTLSATFRYRTKGKGMVRFFASQREVGGKVLASVEVFLPPSEEWTVRTVEANVVEDVHRIDLAVRNELRAGSEMEISSIEFELKPRTFAGKDLKRHVIVREWRTVKDGECVNFNIGTAAHGPSTISQLLKFMPGTKVTAWADVPLSDELARMMRRRFPDVQVVWGEYGPNATPELKAAAESADVLLVGSSSGLHGKVLSSIRDFRRLTGKPVGCAAMGTANPAYRDLNFGWFRDERVLADAEKRGDVAPVHGYAPDSVFYFDCADDEGAERFLKKHGLERGKFVCAIPGNRVTPRWEFWGQKPNAKGVALNAKTEEPDNAVLRAAIEEVVRRFGLKVLVCAEQRTEVALGKRAVMDRLPDDVRKSCVWTGDYWSPDLALSVYKASRLVFGIEMHSQVMALGNGVPAVILVHPNFGTKDDMWRTIGCGAWRVDITEKGAAERAVRVVSGILSDEGAARAKVAAARAFIDAKSAAMFNASF